MEQFTLAVLFVMAVRRGSLIVNITPTQGSATITIQQGLIVVSTPFVSLKPYSYTTNIKINIPNIAPPTRFQVVINETNLCTLSWQPPANITKRHGAILYYTVYCSTNGGFGKELIVNTTSAQTSQNFMLQPYRVYKCCIFGVNEVGRGNSSCQTIITHEAGMILLYIVILFMFNKHVLVV